MSDSHPPTDDRVTDRRIELDIPIPRCPDGWNLTHGTITEFDVALELVSPDGRTFHSGWSEDWSDAVLHLAHQLSFLTDETGIGDELRRYENMFVQQILNQLRVDAALERNPYPMFRDESLGPKVTQLGHYRDRRREQNRKSST